MQLFIEKEEVIDFRPQMTSQNEQYAVVVLLTEVYFASMPINHKYIFIL